jgi:hypothetical protein
MDEGLTYFQAWMPLARLHDHATFRDIHIHGANLAREGQAVAAIQDAVQGIAHANVECDNVYLWGHGHHGRITFIGSDTAGGGGNSRAVTVPLTSIYAITKQAAGLVNWYVFCCFCENPGALANVLNCPPAFNVPWKLFINHNEESGFLTFASPAYGGAIQAVVNHIGQNPTVDEQAFPGLAAGVPITSHSLSQAWMNEFHGMQVDINADFKYWNAGLQTQHVAADSGNFMAFRQVKAKGKKFLKRRFLTHNKRDIGAK